MEDVSAADELVAGDGRVRKQDGDDAEDARSLVVAGLKQVRDGVLGEFAGAWSDEVDEEQSGPPSGGLPECGEAVLVGVLGAAQEGAGAYPGAEECEDEDDGGERAAGDEVVSTGCGPCRGD